MPEDFISFHRQASLDNTYRITFQVFLVSLLLSFFTLINLVLLFCIDFSYLRQTNLELYYLILIPLTIVTLLISYHYWCVPDRDKICSSHVSENKILHKFFLGVFILATFASYIFIILIWHDHLNHTILFKTNFWNQLFLKESLKNNGIKLLASDYWKYDTLDIIIRIYSSILLLLPVSLGCLLIIVAVCSSILICLGE